MIITNGKIVLPDAILEGSSILIREGTIGEIGPQPDLLTKYPGEELLDAQGQYILPGNICAHTHFYGAFARGLAIPGPAPKDFPEILRKLWWPLDKALDEEAVRLSALVMLVDAIRNGTTTLIDHHASPNAIAGSLDIIAEAVLEAGVRGVLCYEVTDRDGVEKARLGIAENQRFIAKIQRGYGNGQLGALFGLHASLTLSNETLAACRDAVDDGTGFHIHVAEHEADEYDSLQKSGLRVIDRLYRAGILGPTSLVAHVVHIDLQEAALLAQTKTWVTHQPRSNMNNAVGTADIEGLVRMGIPVCLGTDGFPHSMWEEARFAYMLHKAAHRDPRRMPGDLLYRILTRHNAGLAMACLPGVQLGQIQVGQAADLIFVDAHPHTPLTPGNLPWHVIFGFYERMITTTIVAGKILMADRKLLTLDEAEIAEKARKLAPSVWARYQKFAS